jgi:hypothetical protein
MMEMGSKTTKITIYVSDVPFGLGGPLNSAFFLPLSELLLALSCSLVALAWCT